MLYAGSSPVGRPNSNRSSTNWTGRLRPKEQLSVQIRMSGPCFVCAAIAQWQSDGIPARVMVGKVARHRTGSRMFDSSSPLHKFVGDRNRKIGSCNRRCD